MKQLTFHRNDNGSLEGFEFINIEEVSDEFDAERVHALRLRQRMYGDEWEFTALYCPDWDNVMLTGNRALDEEEYIEQAIAAFSYLSVILK